MTSTPPVLDSPMQSLERAARQRSGAITHRCEHCQSELYMEMLLLPEHHAIALEDLAGSGHSALVMTAMFATLGGQSGVHRGRSRLTAWPTRHRFWAAP